MNTNLIRLRISAKKLYERLFFDVKLEDFFNFAGYSLSNHAASIEKRAEALARVTRSPKSTVRRWITGETQPNGTNTFLIYGAVLSHVYGGDQVRMLYDFLHWHDRSLIKDYFFDASEIAALEEAGKDAPAFDHNPLD